MCMVHEIRTHIAMVVGKLDSTFLCLVSNLLVFFFAVGLLPILVMLRLYQVLDMFFKMSNQSSTRIFLYH